jgi:hypothetical protein
MAQTQRTIMNVYAVLALKDLADGTPVSAEDIARLKEYLIDIFDIKGLRDKEFELKVNGKNLLQMYVDFVVDSNYEPYLVEIVFESQSHPFRFENWIGELRRLMHNDNSE